MKLKKIKKALRDMMLEQGYLDGRYRTKVVKSKKHKKDKNKFMDKKDLERE